MKIKSIACDDRQLLAILRSENFGPELEMQMEHVDAHTVKTGSRNWPRIARIGRKQEML